MKRRIKKLEDIKDIKGLNEEQVEAVNKIIDLYLKGKKEELYKLIENDPIVREQWERISGYKISEHLKDKYLNENSDIYWKKVEK